MKVAPGKNPRVSNELPTSYIVLLQLIAGGTERILGDSAGRGTMEAWPGFLWTSPPLFSLFANFALYPFSVIHFSPDYDFYAESCESSWWTAEPKGGPRNP